MNYYIVVDEKENKIMKAQEKDVVIFKKEYGSKILVEGDSVQDLLTRLSEKINAESAEAPPALFR